MTLYQYELEYYYTHYMTVECSFACTVETGDREGRERRARAEANFTATSVRDHEIENE
jgi:hypothetical protein